MRGDTLIVLRRGRLFTVSLAGGRMRPVDAINAFPPGTDGDGWYDEMLVADGWVVVIGYSYEGGGTELNRFRISPEGRLGIGSLYVGCGGGVAASALLGGQRAVLVRMPGVVGHVVAAVGFSCGSCRRACWP